MIARPDPWSVVPGAPHVRSLGRRGQIMVIVIMGSLPAVHVWRFSAAPRHAAALVVLAAFGWTLLLRWCEGGDRVRLLGLVPAAGMALALAFPHLGATPTVLAVAGTTLAYGAVLGTMWGRVGDAAVGVLAGPALGTLLASQVIWIRSSSRPAVVAGYLVTAAIIAGYEARPVGAERVGLLLSRTVQRVAHILGVAILLVVALPVIYLPGLLVRGARAVGRAPLVRRSSTDWHKAVVPSVGERWDEHRPFVPTAPATRWLRTLIGVVSIGCVVALALGRWGADPSRRTVPPARTQPSGTTVATAPGDRSIFALEGEALYSELPAYADSTFADELQLEQASVPPDEGASFAGRHLNVDAGIRRTREAPVCQCRKVTLWLSGGSAAWGEGQRDDFTIASQLVRLAERDGIALEVVNLGQRGSIFALDVDRVESFLASKPAPDLVVFYNGWNDALSSVASAFALGPDPDRPIGPVNVDLLIQMNDRVDDFLESDVGPGAGRSAAAGYREQLDRISRLGREHHFETAYFLQADALNSERHLAPYEAITNISPEDFEGSPLAEALKEMEDGLPTVVTSLRWLFVDDPRAVFVGLVHQNEVGAQTVAEAIYDQIGSKLRGG